MQKVINISLDNSLLEEARMLGINISRACERGLADQIAEMRRQPWLDENRDAIESSNTFVEAHGLPLAQYRQF